MGREVAKTTSWSILGVAMMPVGIHTMAHTLLVGHIVVRAILVPHHIIGTLHDAIVLVMTLKGWQNSHQKNRPVDI